MKNKGGLFLVVFLLMLFLVAIIFTPIPTDWTYNYSKDSKDPHGSYILFEELNQIFPNAEIIVADTTIIATLENWNTPNTAYIAIGDMYQLTHNSYTRGKTAFDAIKTFLNNDSTHNQVFLASNQYEYSFYLNENDTIPKRIKSKFAYSNYSYNQSDLSVQLGLNQENSIYYPTTTEYANTYILLDAVPHHQLGNLDGTYSNFIKIPFHNKNALYLHSNPNVFTNYAMLNDSLANYVAKTLSHLEDVDYVIWDEYNKPNAQFFGQFRVEKKSPLYLINNSQPLYIAKILTILGCLLLLFTHLKRRQQAIPIVQPPQNKSVEFVTNMGQLYHEKGNHHDIARKKIDYFEFELRKQFKLNDINTYKKKPETLAKLTGFQQEDIEQYFRRKQLVEQVSQLDETQLLQVSNAIENLKKNQQ